MAAGAGASQAGVCKSLEDQLRTWLAAVGLAAGAVVVAAAVEACGASGGWRIPGMEVVVESEREEAPKVGWVMVESSSVSIGWVMTLVAGEGASAGLGGLTYVVANNVSHCGLR